MTELKTLLEEAKSSLQDLESLLQRVRSLHRDGNDPYLPTPEQIKSYADEILKIMERIPANLILQEKRRCEGEVEQLQREMEQVRRRVEGAVQKLEAACERNVTQLADFIENLHQRLATTTQEGHGTPPISQLNELLRKGRNFLESRDYEACMRTMNEALHVAPNNSEAASCLEEAQRKWEDQQLEEELVVHIDDLKKEATELFDQEKYRECVGMFRFLCELEPKNHTLQDYLELSQQRVQEIEESERRRQAAQDQIAQPKSANSPAETASSSVVPPAGTSGNNHGSSPSHEHNPPASPSRALGVLVDEDFDCDAGSTALPSETTSKGAELANSGKYLLVVLGVLVALVAVLVCTQLLRNRSAQPENAGLPPVTSPASDSPAQFNVGPPSSTQTAVEEPLPPRAIELFNRGQLLEASQLCDTILGKNPRDSVAREIKQKIRAHYWRQSQQAKSRKKPTEVRKALENLLRVFPGDAAALRELKTLQGAGSKEPLPVSENNPGTRLEDLHRQIAAAMSAGTYFPPASGNAWILVGGLSPTDPVFKEKMDQLHREAVSQMQRKIQTKDTEGARALGRQLQEYFPASAELRGLRESLRGDETQQQEVRSGLAQKLDAALVRGHYVTPVSDNALTYCNRLLALDAQNQRFQAQKEEIFTKAAAQARNLTQSQKFDEARDVLSALVSFAQNDGKTQVIQEAKAQLERLEFTAFPVIHDHALGTCSGRLRMNAYIISYVPSGDSKDSFSERLTDIIETESGDKFKIQLKGKIYRFQPNLVKGKEETRQRVQEMHQKLTSLMGRGK